MPNFTKNNAAADGIVLDNLGQILGVENVENSPNLNALKVLIRNAYSSIMQQRGTIIGQDDSDEMAKQIIKAAQAFNVDGMTNQRAEQLVSKMIASMRREAIALGQGNGGIGLQY